MSLEIYPYSRKVVLQQKSEKEQKELVNSLAPKDPLITPADQHPVIVTDKPLPSIEESLKTQKPTISVVEETPAPTITKQPAQPVTEVKGDLLKTTLAISLLTIGAYLIYDKFIKA
jgi:hypothetical protein